MAAAGVTIDDCRRRWRYACVGRVSQGSGSSPVTSALPENKAALTRSITLGRPIRNRCPVASPQSWPRRSGFERKVSDTPFIRTPI